LIEYKADVNQEFLGEFPLLLAVKNVNIIRLLIDNGANVN